MERDMVEWKKWLDWHKGIEEAEFAKEKAKAIADAGKVEDGKMRAGMLYKANKMRFLFDKTKLINYGNCLKFNKAVSFIPDTCQIETQDCFVHRKDFVPSESGKPHIGSAVTA